MESVIPRNDSSVELLHKEQCLAKGISPSRGRNAIADSLNRNFVDHHEWPINKDILHQIFHQWDYLVIDLFSTN